MSTLGSSDCDSSKNSVVPLILSSLIVFLAAFAISSAWPNLNSVFCNAPPTISYREKKRVRSLSVNYICGISTTFSKIPHVPHWLQCPTVVLVLGDEGTWSVGYNYWQPIKGTLSGVHLVRQTFSRFTLSSSPWNAWNKSRHFGQHATKFISSRIMPKKSRHTSTFSLMSCGIRLTMCAILCT